MTMKKLLFLLLLSYFPTNYTILIGSEESVGIILYYDNVDHL